MTGHKSAFVLFKGSPPVSYLREVLSHVLEDPAVDEETTVTINTMRRDQAIQIPDSVTGGVMSTINGEETMLIPPGGVITWDQCPDGGIVLLPESPET